MLRIDHIARVHLGKECLKDASLAICENTRQLGVTAVYGAVGMTFIFGVCYVAANYQRRKVCNTVEES